MSEIRQVNFKIGTRLRSGFATQGGGRHINFDFVLVVFLVLDALVIHSATGTSTSTATRTIREILGSYTCEFLCGRAQEVCSLGVNRSGAEVMGFPIDAAIDLSIP